MPSVLNLGRQHCSGRAPKILLIIQSECLLELHRVCHSVSDDVVSFLYMRLCFSDIRISAYIFQIRIDPNMIKAVYAHICAYFLKSEYHIFNVVSFACAHKCA